MKGLEGIPPNSLDNKILLGQVTLGLAYIHSKGIIHKDLNPANILLWKKSSESTLVLAKIADYSFAKQLKYEQKEFSETINPGKKSFMAPELLMKLDTGEKYVATFASDAYSLGITIIFTLKHGLDIEDLEWDVTDLVLKLTKEKPNERPIVGLVIYHPYFSLTNENTKTYFHEKICGFFESSQWSSNKYFTKENIEEWLDTNSLKIKGALTKKYIDQIVDRINVDLMSKTVNHKFKF